MPNLAPLPIGDVLPALVDALRTRSAIVLRAPPGAGKTTRVPPAILDAGLAENGKIVVLQPRRVAARATAARISHERGTRLGDEIGYQVRFESRTGPRTRIEIVTEGILLRALADNPFLEGTNVVVFDEFHERSLTSDLALGMVRQVQASVRPDLKIVVMSATLAAEPIAAYLEGCPIVESQGRMFPVDVRHLPHLEKRPLPELVSEAVEMSMPGGRGDCLVFLPGVGEIRQVGKRLAAWCKRQSVQLLELYGDLPAEKQDAVLEPSEERKLILATNVAETSLTIPGVTLVIDSGLARINRYDEHTGLDRLELSPISKASADQRAGRAGRTQASVCIRLWPEAAHRHRPDFDEPEIRRVDLAGAVLQLLAWIEPDFEQFPWFEPPSTTAIAQARLLLARLDAADERGITPLGRTMGSLPVHPRLSRLLLEGKRLGHPHAVAMAAALLSDRDPFLRGPGPRRRPSHASPSDVLDRLAALAAYERDHTLDSDVGTLNAAAARTILRARDQLARLVERADVSTAVERLSHDEAVLRALLAAFPDRVARRRKRADPRGVMVGGRGIRLSDQSALDADAELFVCVDIDAVDGEAFVRQASAIERSWLSPEHMESSVEIFFDEAIGRVSARKRTAWNGLVLEESQAGLSGDEQMTPILAQAAADHFDRAFPEDDQDLLSLINRIRCLAEWMPSLELPLLDAMALRRLLPQLCYGRRSLADVRAAPWKEAVLGLLTWPQRQALDREAPERIEVPSGSHIAIAYEPGRPPVLAVRIQEVFGLLETPRIAGGRVPVLMHLLAPNMRVAQVTGDLASFWANTYALVRKDLRARYPKHAWPEDPFTAKAERKPRRR
ncbi:MAG: ATP-dependent helicase HrpB [Pirellulaceae bacterium]